MRTVFFLILFVFHISYSQDYYQTLGLSRNADDTQIKKAFHSLSLQYHPDKNPDDASATARYVEIVQAYEILSDPSTRSMYDSGNSHHDGAQRASSSSSSGTDNPHVHGDNAVLPWYVPLQYIYTGGTLSVGLRKPVPCGLCHGSGRIMHTAIGEVAGSGADVASMNQDPGQMGEDTRGACSRCNGQGHVMGSMNYPVHVIPGAPDGSIAKIQGAGSQMHAKMIPGSVTLRLFAAPHEVFKRVGVDLLTTINITSAEARLGFLKNITHMDNRIVPISYQPDGNQTQCGSCYGADGDQCCNTCAAVREAYGRRGWSFTDSDFIQCDRQTTDHQTANNQSAEPSTENERTVRSFEIRIPGEGMPFHNAPHQHGELIVTCVVQPHLTQLPPVVDKQCVNDCLGFGFCNTTVGQCNCFDGRSGDDCLITAEELAYFWKVYDAQQVAAREVQYWSQMWFQSVQYLMK